MKVGIREFRSQMKSWMERARSGEEIVITERGQPIARLVPVSGRSGLQGLEDRGLILRRPTNPDFDLGSIKPVKVEGSISDLVVEQRR